jgi:hypothetical protein
MSDYGTNLDPAQRTAQDRLDEAAPRARYPQTTSIASQPRSAPLGRTASSTRWAVTIIVVAGVISASNWTIEQLPRPPGAVEVWYHDC